MRQPVLASPDAGFHHARFSEPKTSIVVADRSWVHPAIRYWNRLAGWRLFKTGPSPEIITAKRAPSGCGICAWMIDPKDNWKAPYVQCGIAVYSDSRTLSTVAHELGHCLGLVHQRRGSMSAGPTDREFDARLLRLAGYSFP